MSKVRKVRVLNVNPSNVVVCYSGEDRKIRMSKQFFRKRVEMGILEIEEPQTAEDTI